METERMIAVEIMDVFEEFLAERGVQIPSNDREGLPEEACIYGTEYYGMEDRITDTLKSHKSTFADEAAKAAKDKKKGKSKLKKWSCGCTNIRVAVQDVEIQCLKCFNMFQLVE